MSDLRDLSLTELSQELRMLRVSPVQVTESCLAAIDREDSIYNSFLTVCREAALREARNAERELREGRWRGPLHGVPLALKDLFLTAGVRTTGGSGILKDWVPDRDACVVRRLRGAGAILLGKLNMHEFAYGATSLNPHYGPSRNPRDPTRLTGGSSGGSAAAVAARLCYGALGSDTGGSIRCPAALCGLVGLKPTYGRVSRAGVLPLAWSLDHVGPMTRTVPDAALLLEAISGHDPADPTSARRPVPNFAKLMEGGVRGLRLGVPVEEFWHPVHPGVATRVEQAITLLKEAGAEIERLSLPLLSMSGAVQSVIIHAEATAYHRKHLRTHSAEYSRSVRLRLMEGLFLSADDYVTAQRARHRVRAEMLEALKRVDAFLTPTVPVPAPKLDAEWVEAGEVVAPPQYFMVKNTAVFNLTGLPAVTVPCGETAGLPVGLQIAGRPWDESLILRIARAVEERLPSRRDSTADPSNG